MYEVVVLKDGYSRLDAEGCMQAGGTITLLKGQGTNILVDTGSPWDRELLLSGLSKNKVSPEEVHYVVSTHGHVDHVGNLNLFTRAMHICGFDICCGDNYVMHDFKQGIPYEIDADVEVWPTPGHSDSDVSVVVRNTRHGTVAVAGDLFECQEDLDNPSLWQANSRSPRMQQEGRIDVLKAADWIVPGHGPMFPVPRELKQQMRVVMLTEEHVVMEDKAKVTTRSQCIIVEVD